MLKITSGVCVCVCWKQKNLTECMNLLKTHKVFAGYLLNTTVILIQYLFSLF